MALQLLLLVPAWHPGTSPSSSPSSHLDSGFSTSVSPPGKWGLGLLLAQMPPQRLKQACQGREHRAAPDRRAPSYF